jgi:hypothetical protein
MVLILIPQELALQTSASIVKADCIHGGPECMVCGGHPSGTTLCVSTTRFLIIVALGAVLFWPPRGSHRLAKVHFPLWIRNDKLSSPELARPQLFDFWRGTTDLSLQLTFPVTVKASAASSYRIHTALIQRTDFAVTQFCVTLKNVEGSTA